MAMNLTVGNYVKFIRSTTAAWESLSASERNSDTLYFVMDADDTQGTLYLGNVLIAGGVASAATLAELQDIAIDSGALAAGDVLVYDGTTQKWINSPLTSVIGATITTLVGATADTDGASGLVPAPSAGDQNKVLTGDGLWTDLTDTIGTIATEKAQAEIATLIGDGTLPEELDTLKEIVTYIQSNESEAGLIANIEALQKTVYGAEATDTTEAVVGLVDLVATNTTNITQLQEDVTEIQDALRWQDMSLTDDT